MENLSEIWKDIPNYEGLYQASNMGKIRSLDRVVNGKYGNKPIKKGKILKQFHVGNGHRAQVCLIKNGIRHYPIVSRLILETFVGVIPEGMQVNHIDENPANNALSNLNLMSPKDNTNWGTGIERSANTRKKLMKGRFQYCDNPNAKPILQYSLDGEFIKRWDCARYAIEELGLCQASLSTHLHGNTKSCGGFFFRFA